MITPDQEEDLQNDKVALPISSSKFNQAEQQLLSDFFFNSPFFIDRQQEAELDMDSIRAWMKRMADNWKRRM